MSTIKDIREALEAIGKDAREVFDHGQSLLTLKAGTGRIIATSDRALTALEDLSINHSDEEIERVVKESISDNAHVGLALNDASALTLARAFMERGLRYARENWMRDPHPVGAEKIVEVVWRWAIDAQMVNATTEPYYITNDLRKRLSSVLGNQWMGGGRWVPVALQAPEKDKREGDAPKEEQPPASLEAMAREWLAEKYPDMLRAEIKEITKQGFEATANDCAAFAQFVLSESNTSTR